MGGYPNLKVDVMVRRVETRTFVFLFCIFFCVLFSHVACVSLVSLSRYRFDISLVWWHFWSFFLSLVALSFHPDPIPTCA